MTLVKELLRLGRFAKAAHLATALLLCVGATSGRALATPALRYQVAQRGDMVLFGNTLGYDCRATIPAPVVGTVNTNNCGTNTDDQDIDVLWSSDTPAAGGATADPTITPMTARSTALLTLPPGAIVTYARLYWSAEGPKNMIMSGAQVLVERPGMFSQNVTADTTGQVDVPLLVGTHYQQTADITSLVQLYGPGAYRVSNVPTVSPVNQLDQLLYAAWSVVVFYRLPAQPPRSLTVFDGFDEVSVATAVSATLNGFLVPNAGFDAKFGVIGYQGDFDNTGDRIAVNGTLLQDAENPPTNFFNSTRSALGQALTTVGDLPQMNGQPGSMTGIDMDIIDITGLVHAGDKSLQVSASTTNDTYFLGMFAGSVATLQPVFSDTELDYQDNTNPGGSVRPGDNLTLTVTLPNTGTDTGVNTTLSIPIPPGLTYVPKTIKVDNGNNAGPKTDSSGDDQAEYDPTTKTITIRVGNNASATKGGSVATTDTPPVVEFQVTVDPSANNTTIAVSGVVTAAGMVGSMQGIPPGSWNTGSIVTPLDGPGKGVPTFYPNSPLTIPVQQCATNLDCPTSMPRCDTTQHMCTNGCATNADCTGIGIGQVCLPSKMCGCNADSDCLSDSCNTGSHQCSIPTADISVTVTTLPNPTVPGQPIQHVITVTNNGPGGAPPGTTVIYTVPPGGTIKSIDPGPAPGWTCMQSQRTVTCVDSQPIPPSTDAPKITITVVPAPNAMTVPVNVTAKNPNTTDPNPNNNTVIRTDTIGGPGTPLDQLAGGGFSCNIGQDSATRAQTAALFALLCGMGLLLLRRRRGVER